MGWILVRQQENRDGFNDTPDDFGPRRLREIDLGGIHADW
jgi:hypothetical protein